MGTESQFGINDGNADSKFKTRVNSIFGCLDNLEKKHNETCEENKPESFDERVASTNNHTGSCDLGLKKKESGDFKKPFSPNQKRSSGKKTPDHILNPSKWTKYSLKEDGTKELRKEGMTANQLNKRVAIDFINDIRNRKTNEIEISNQCQSKLTYKKPISEDKLAKNSEFSCGSSHSGKAVIMKTYEFGEKKSKSTKICTIVGGIKKDKEKSEIPVHSVQLTHVSSNDSTNENVDDRKNISNEIDDSNQVETTFIHRKKKQRNIRKRETENSVE